MHDGWTGVDGTPTRGHEEGIASRRFACCATWLQGNCTRPWWWLIRLNTMIDLHAGKHFASCAVVDAGEGQRSEFWTSPIQLRR